MATTGLNLKHEHKTVKALPQRRMIAQKFRIVNVIISVEFDAQGVSKFYKAAVKPWR